MFLGLDLSLAQSGVVIIDENGKVLVKDAIKTTRVNDSVNTRFTRYHMSMQGVLDSIKFYDIKCIAIESQAFGSKGKLIELGESKGITTYEVLKNFPDVEIIEVAPQSLKKYMVGKGKKKSGKEGKQQVIDSCFDKYGFETKIDDIADAYTLSRIARDYFLDCGCEYDYQDEVIKMLKAKSLKENCEGVVKPKVKKKKK